MKTVTLRTFALFNINYLVSSQDFATTDETALSEIQELLAKVWPKELQSKFVRVNQHTGEVHPNIYAMQMDETDHSIALTSYQTKKVLEVLGKANIKGGDIAWFLPAIQALRA